ncbi:hypothetical protein GQ457_03G013000 [Hibiscus cannabinus]
MPWFPLVKMPWSLLTHELMSQPLIREKEKKIKKQGINVNSIALKSSKKLQEDSSAEESEEDDEMEYLVKNFTHFMKHEKEISRHEPKKKMKEPQRAQSSNKRGSSSKKAYVATWSDEEDSTENEVAHLCFIALQEGEITSNSSSSNSYTFNKFKYSYDELVFEFKASFSKNKKLLSKLKLENERQSSAPGFINGKCFKTLKYDIKEELHAHRDGHLKKECFTSYLHSSVVISIG